MSAAPVGSPRILFCAPLPPEFDRESGSRRIYHLVEHMRAAGATVAFVCENAPADSPHVRHLRQLGVPTYVGFGRHVEDLVEAGDFDVAVFAFWYLADRYADVVRRRSPSTRIVVETVDLHWLRNARRLLGGREGAPGRLDDAFASDFIGELNTYAAADGVLTVSEKEAALINDLTGHAGLAHAVPDFDEVERGLAPFSQRNGVVFVGNFRHPPNLDAVEYFCQEVLPLVSPRLLREHPVRIVGNGPGARVHELAAAREGVSVVGWVPSVIPYLQRARVSVVPLRYGAGTKRKLIQALLAGTPTVTTSVGGEGLPVADGEHVLMEDDAGGFAAALERLLTDEALWDRMADSGRRRMAELHGRAVSLRRSSDALDAILARPARALHGTGAVKGDDASGRSGEAIRHALRETVPPASRVLVVSKGDPELVRLPDVEARHFPQGEDGGYAGFHPRDSRAAIGHLEELGHGADFLLVPSTAFWWLEYYGDFARHLGEEMERVWADEACMIFRFQAEPPTSGVGTAHDSARVSATAWTRATQRGSGTASRSAG